MGEGYVHQRSLLPHVVPRRHERVALAEARLRDFGEVRSSVEHGPEAAVDVVSRHRLPIAGPLDRRRDATARSQSARDRTRRRRLARVLAGGRSVRST